MQQISNWNDVQAAGESRKSLPAGGYVCMITAVENVEPKQYLRIEFDIAEGPYAGYGEEFLERNGWTPLRFIRSYKDRAVGMFKAFISNVEKCNPRFVWKWDEKALVGFRCGLLLGEEEYRKNDGTIGTRLAVAKLLTLEEIDEGRYEIPPKKTLPVDETPPAWTPSSAPADDLPADL